jgi:hypothetical protein
VAEIIDVMRRVHRVSPGRRLYRLDPAARFFVEELFQGGS